MTSPDNFLLVGNGPYMNRGCEAIVRGTMEILRREFGEDIRVTVASFGSEEAIAKQAAAEYDPAITHLALGQLGGAPRWSRQWFTRQMHRIRHPFSDMRYIAGHRSYKALDTSLSTANAALEIGGDNYSLDYNWPAPFLAMDRYIQGCGVPVVLWGASVGPFDAAPIEQQNLMFKHLSSLKAVLVRESGSLEYLKGHGVSSVYPVCDPAFIMKLRKPDLAGIGFALPASPIGINFSPLMARYVTGGDMSRWISLCVEIVKLTYEATRHPIVLIPHVTFNSVGNDDFLFLQRVLGAFPAAPNMVSCLPDSLSAAEIKWVISQCLVVAAARTHAAIAGLSSCVPTLSFAYSMKAYGINKDVYGSHDYCLPPAELLMPGKVALRLSTMLTEAEAITNLLKKKMPDIINGAYAAGAMLRQVISSGSSVREV